MAKYEISNKIRKPDFRGFISLIGRAMIILGLILLLFVAYQLWGTNFFEQKNQNNLRDRFAKKMDNVKKANVKPTTPGDGDNQSIPGDNPTVSTPNQQPSEQELKQEVKPGEPIAVIKIPKIGVDNVVISGTDKASLQKGPGHYPATPLPGQYGNSAIAGHRTTYGAPFARLDEIGEGDLIILETVRGTFTYKINQPSIVVNPSDVSVINPTPDPSDPSKLLPTLTLTTCHPKYSAAKRLVVRAILIPNESAPVSDAHQLKDSSGSIPKVINIGNDDDTLGKKGTGHENILVAMGAASMHLPLLWWFLLLVTTGMIWWWLYRRYHTWYVWILGAIPFAGVLLLYFINLEHALPSNL